MELSRTQLRNKLPVKLPAHWKDDPIPAPKLYPRRRRGMLLPLPRTVPNSFYKLPPIWNKEVDKELLRLAHMKYSYGEIAAKLSILTNRRVTALAVTGRLDRIRVFMRKLESET